MAFSPETIAGIDYTMAGVVTRIFLFIVTAILLYFATKRGAGVVKKTEETLSIVQNNAKVANTISANLNTTIHKSMSSVHALADGSSSVKSAASQMGQVVEDTANATVSVMDKINAATTEINRNHELAVSLDQGFQKVQSAVEKGNGAIQTAKSSILSGGDRRFRAQIDRFAAYRDEPDHIDSRRDQFHCIPDESVVVKCIY